MSRKVVYAMVVLMLVAAACAPAATPTPAPTVAPAAPVPTTAAPTPATTVPAAAPTAVPAPARALAQRTVLRFADFHYPQQEFTKEWLVYWMNLVKERTGGQVDFDVHLSGSLIGAVEQLNGMQVGIADAGTIMSMYTPKELSLAQFLELPYLFKDEDQAYKVGSRLLEGAIERQVENLGLKIISYQMDAGRVIFARGTPIMKLEDMKGRKLRASGAFERTLLERWGASPIFMPWADVVVAMRLGTVDGATMPLGQLSDREDLWGPTAVSVYAGANVGVPVLLAMNLKKFQALPPETQKVLLAAGQEAGDHFHAFKQQKRDSDIALLKDKVKKPIYFLPAEELTRWSTVAKPLVDEWVKQNGDQGELLNSQYKAVLSWYEKTSGR